MTNCLRRQRTIKGEVSCSGVGLHSGKEVNLTLKPSAENTGILFYRKDMGNKYPLTKALIKNLTDTRLSTTIGYNGNSVHTIEHLMASFVELGIDNVIAEIDAPEVPIMDGSAAPFVALIKKAGITEQDAIQPYIKITNSIELSVNGKEILIEPAERLCVTFYINYDHPVVGEQLFSYVSSEEGFEREIANARTYGFLKEVRQLMALGLANGGSLDNAIVIGDNAILNEGGLKFKDEFVRHKILDLLGDIALLGMPVIGHIHAKKSGHALNTQFVNEILKRKDSWILMGKKGAPSPQITAPAAVI